LPRGTCYGPLPSCKCLSRSPPRAKPSVSASHSLLRMSLATQCPKHIGCHRTRPPERNAPLPAVPCRILQLFIPIIVISNHPHAPARCPAHGVCNA
jgi:hypothetical protein